jgi:hypothetical protein
MNKKNKVIIVRYTSEQKNILQQKADNAGLSLSEFLRQAADNAEIIVKDNSINLKMIYEVNKFGNNINQLAKAANIANLNGKISDKIYQQFIFKLKLYTDEIKSLTHLIKMKDKI